MNIQQDILVKIIKDSEQKYNETYVCPAGKLTIGYGHTGKDVKEGMVISDQRCEELLRDDIEKVSKQLEHLFKKYKITVNDNMRYAFTSLVFNMGIGDFEKCSFIKHLQNGDVIGAGLLILSIRKAGGRYLRGLQIRRAKEVQLYFGLYDSKGKLLSSTSVFPIWSPLKALTLKGKAMTESTFNKIFKFPF